MCSVQTVKWELSGLYLYTHMPLMHQLACWQENIALSLMSFPLSLPHSYSCYIDLFLGPKIACISSHNHCIFHLFLLSYTVKIGQKKVAFKT